MAISKIRLIIIANINGMSEGRKSGGCMTETELNEQITVLLAASNQIGCQGGRGRRYRRRQKSLKGDRLLRMSHYGLYGLALFSTRSIRNESDEKIYTLHHSGAYIGYLKNSNRKQYLKKQSNKCARRYPFLTGKGNQYRRVFDYWWRLD